MHSVLVSEHDENTATAKAWGPAGSGRIALWIGIHSPDLLGIDDILWTRALEGEPFFAPAVDITSPVQCTAPSGRPAMLPGEAPGMWITLIALSVDSLGMRDATTSAGTRAAVGCSESTRA